MIGVYYMCWLCFVVFFFFKQKTAYEMRISDWSSDVCSSDLRALPVPARRIAERTRQARLHRRAPLRLPHRPRTVELRRGDRAGLQHRTGLDDRLSRRRHADPRSFGVQEPPERADRKSTGLNSTP